VIEVKVKIDKNKLLKEILAKGHSGLGTKGNDILCAGVSVLLETTMLALNKLPLVNIEKEDNGKVYQLKLKNINNDLAGEIRGITIFIITGLNVLSSNYKDNFKFKIIE
jgi:uncharacterized protein YsxB (DUF464 family)